MKKIGCYAVAGLLAWACTSKTAEKTEDSVHTALPEEVSEVRVMRLDYSDFRQELISNGTVTARRKADLRFQTGDNVVAAVYVKNGDHVAKGQKIAALDSFRLQNTKAQSADNLARARLELQDVLIGQGYSLNDSAKIPAEVMLLAKVRSNYEQSRIQYELADYNARNATLRAPFAGVVANLFGKACNLPGNSDPFCTVIDHKALEVNFLILENELPLVQLGNAVEVSPFSFSDMHCEGQVSEINPAVDRNGMVRIKALLKNHDNKLYDGMNVKVRLQRSAGRQLVIPKEALVLRSNKKVVFTLKGNQAQWVYVETGPENSTGYVVTSGLAVGDSVIYEGNINLAHESHVKVK